MALRSCIHSAGLAVLLLSCTATIAEPLNRGVDSVHQPIVDRTDFALDVSVSKTGLAPGEADRLSGWFDNLRLGYGDTITLADPAGWRGGAARDAVGGVAARYGMLLSRDAAPLTVGLARPGTLRVVVSRAVAHVEGCSDWTPDPGTEYGGGTMNNYGCATAVNFAAMVANPQDLVAGHSGGRSGDAQLSVKAIKSFRDADVTGKGALKSESTKSGGN